VSSGVIKTTFSDHFMVFTQLESLQYESSNKTHNRVKFRNFANFDIDSFKHDVHNAFSGIDFLSITDVHVGWSQWKNEFLKVCDKHAPLVERRLKPRNNPWITSDIIKKMYHRNFIHDKATRNKDVLWNEYKQLRNSINSDIKTAKRLYYDEEINRAKCSPKLMWRKINSLIRNNKHSRQEFISANAFNTYFNSVGKKCLKALNERLVVEMLIGVILNLCTTSNSLKSSNKTS
jgi:hypothetical protein